MSNIILAVGVVWLSLILVLLCTAATVMFIDDCFLNGKIQKWTSKRFSQ